jgi:hypothetical protein
MYRGFFALILASSMIRGTIPPPIWRTVDRPKNDKRAIVTAATKAQSAADYLHGLQASKKGEAA